MGMHPQVSAFIMTTLSDWDWLYIHQLDANIVRSVMWLSLTTPPAGH